MIPDTISLHAYVVWIFITAILSMGYIMIVRMGPLFWDIFYNRKSEGKLLAKLLAWFVVYLIMAIPMIYADQFFK